MSQITTRLGYGQTGIIEVDQFTRLMNEQFYDDEIVKCDKPSSWNNTAEYIGVAPETSQDSDPVWSVIKIFWIRNKKSYVGFKSNLTWTNHTF